MGGDLFPAATSSDIPLADQIAAVEREIRMRERVYPHWVASRKMQQRQADRELLAMQAVLATLQRIRA